MRSEPRPYATILLTISGIILLILFWIVSDNSGKFVYTLDDPYIHLALAKQIAKGHYGINPGENSAPSSSILWPLLLAPFAGSSFGEFIPFVICVLCALASTFVAVRRFGGAYSPWLPALGVLILTNQLGLIFTGMEHSLQVLLAIVAAVGLLSEFDRGKVSPWLVVALATGPLIRYENLAITISASTYLWSRGHRRIAVISLAIPVAGIVAFSLFLKSLGLGFLPSSIVAKSGAGTAGSPAKDLLNNFVRNMTSRETLLECYSFVLILVAAIYATISIKSPARKLALTAVVAGGMHMFLGRFGWAGRYEPYIVAFVGVLLIGVWPKIPFQSLKPTVSRSFGRLAAGTLIVGLVPLALYYTFLRGFRAPNESRDIYLQQYQMHRFVTDTWKRPVAVNDLGWVSYGNDQYVLDLWGLGSYEALNLRGSETGTNWMERLCREHKVEAVMVYEDWFHGAPKGWIKVGVLSRRQGKPRPRDEVSIYATHRGAVESLSFFLDRFSHKLPEGATLNLNGF